MGRSFLGLVSQPCPMGKEQEARRKEALTVSTKSPVHPTSFYTVHFASQSSSQSVTKYRRIRNSRNGSLSPFVCEAAAAEMACEGLKSLNPVLRTSRSSRGI